MLVGRGGDVALVAAEVAERRSVVITGPAGIGKTTAARAALTATTSWAEAGALATLAWSPLLVFRRLLAEAVGDDPAAIAAAVLRRGHQAVLLDDLQWADDASLDVIAHLVGQVAVVATVRTGETRSTLAIASLELVGARHLALAPLASSEARHLVARLHPGLDAVDRESVVARAGGNPLLLTELPTAGDDSSNLVSALLAHLNALDDDGRAAVERLAVLGRPVDIEVLGPGAAAVVQAGLAVELDGRLRMRHGLLSEVIVDLMADRADELRRQLAMVVSDAEAAHLLATAGDIATARARAQRAAAEASDARQRAELLELAIACAPPSEADPDLRLEAARLFLELSQPERAAALCDPPGMADLRREERGALVGVAAVAAWNQDRPERCRELTTMALAELEGTASPEEVFALAGSTIFDTRHGLDGRPALRRARDAVALADAVGAHQRFARLRLASVLLTAQEPGWAELYAAVIDDAAQAGDEAERRSALTSLVLGHWVSGDPMEAHRLAWDDVMRGPAHEHDDKWLGLHAYAAIIGLFVGIDQEVLVERHRAVLDTEPLFRNRQFLEAAVGVALADLGRSAEALERSRGAHDRAGRHPQARSLAWWQMAETAWLDGRLDDAVDAAEEVTALHLGGYPSATLARLLGAHAQRERGDRGLLAGSEPGATLSAWRAAPIEWQALVASLDGRHADGRRLFEEAADAWRGHDVRGEARCRWAAADEARLLGADDAVACLDQAVGLAGDRGILPLVARGRRSLRRAGVVRRVTSGAGQVGLTRREEEVLRLVGDGRSSGDIAAALGIEVSTVDSFVRSATRKLGVTSRVAAAARLADRGQEPN